LPDGFVVNSFSGDDPLQCKDYVRKRAGLGRFEPTRQPKIDNIARMSDRMRKPVAEYVYYDCAGQPSRKVVRTDSKGFPQYRWDGSAWQSGVKGVPLYPYRLPDMLKAAHSGVYICEGEKDADRLASLGFVATTNPMGAGNWHADLNQHFKGKDCYILEDNDKAGRDHVQDVARHLHGVADSVRIVRLPGLPDKGDVSDWLDADPERDGKLVECAKGFPLWTPDAEAVQGGTNATLSIISADNLQAMKFPPVSYVVQGYVVEGLTLLAGKPKIGKSWLVLDIAIAVARGGFTLGDIKCPEGDVLYAALEDNPRRLQNRMSKVIQCQTWPKRLEFATNMPRLNEGGLEFLANWIKGREKPRLIIVDTLAKVRAVRKGNDDPYAADYAAVTGLKAIADEYGVAVVLVHHVRKMDADDPVDTVSGTTGLTGAVDSILVLNRTSQGVTLYGRGRDIEEIDKAAEFNRNTCRWTIKGDAAEVHRTDERAVILEALADNKEPMTPAEISDDRGLPRNNVRQLLFKMCKAGEVLKEKRGRYVHPDHACYSSKTSPPDNIDNSDNNESDDDE
jgi:hypothetical protein